MLKRLSVFAALMGLAAVSLAQERQPRGTAEAQIHGKKVSIDYGRPTLKGRSLDELTAKLPEDRIWRAGENQVTILDAGTALKIGGKEIPAGKYSLYVHIPASGDWALCVNENLGIELGTIYAQAPEAMAKEMWPRLDGYANIKSDEVARIPLTKKSIPATDVFTVDLTPSMLTLSWGEQAWTASIE